MNDTDTNTGYMDDSERATSVLPSRRVMEAHVWVLASFWRVTIAKCCSYRQPSPPNPSGTHAIENVVYSSDTELHLEIYQFHLHVVDPHHPFPPSPPCLFVKDQRIF